MHNNGHASDEDQPQAHHPNDYPPKYVPDDRANSNTC